MFGNLRISWIVGVPVAVYFAVVWTPLIATTVMAPVFALYQLPNVGAALYAADHLGFAGTATVRIAWLLALARFVPLAFMAVFAVRLAVPALRRRGGIGEALGLAVGLGSALGFALMLMAAKVHEQAAVRLHATELLIMLGVVVVMALERPAQARPAVV